MNKMISFSEPTLYIGIDMHKKSWSIHIRTDISDHKGFSMPPDHEQLFNYVEANFSGMNIKLTYEAGCCGFSAARAFMNLGWEVKVVNPADIPRGDKQNYQKTDYLDSRNLCKLLSKDQLQGIYIPSQEQEMLCGLLRQRNNITKMLRKAKNYISSSLLFHGILLQEEFDKPTWSIAFKKWLEELKFEQESGRQDLNSKLRILNCLNQEYLQVGNELRLYCRKHHKKDYYLLMSIPGIGGYLASAILAELGDIRRFKNEREFSSYIGMVPGIHQSGGKESFMGITPRCRAIIRTYLVEAAWVALRKDPELQLNYRKHVGKNPKSVIIKIAHKLVRRILSVIKNEKKYQNNYNQNTMPK
ncbi:MAG: IS110 family transposase [Saprospiraceae bacterium]|nr:IS110 family transposase [Saprospiraceae bacterium]